MSSTSSSTQWDLSLLLSLTLSLTLSNHLSLYMYPSLSLSLSYSPSRFLLSFKHTLIHSCSHTLFDSFSLSIPLSLFSPLFLYLSPALSLSPLSPLSLPSHLPPVLSPSAVAGDESASMCRCSSSLSGVRWWSSSLSHTGHPPLPGMIPHHYNSPLTRSLNKCVCSRGGLLPIHLQECVVDWTGLPRNNNKRSRPWNHRKGNKKL